MWNLGVQGGRGAGKSKNRVAWRLPGAKGWGNGERLVQEYKLSVIRLIRSESLIYGIVTKADNNVCIIKIC